MSSFHDRITEYVASLPADVPPYVAAKRLLDTVTDDDRPALLEWIDQQLPFFISERIKMIRRARGTVAKNHKPSRFATAAEGFAAGDVEALSDFKLVYRIKGEEKPLGQMTGADHEFAAGCFQHMGTNALMLAAVHRQVARVCGDKCTEDVFSPESYARLFGVRSDDDPLAELLAG